jgi:hypothetical protein
VSFTAFLLWRRSLEVAMEHKESSLIRGRSGRQSDGHGGNSGACIDEISQLLKPLTISYESPASLSPAPRNARQHSRRQVSQLCASIGEFGFLVPILVDERRTVIAGHGRLAAAQQLGLNQVPVVHIGHLTAEQKRAYRLADNRLAELSGWDTDILKVELEELSVLNLPFEFEITGFDTVDIDRLRETPKKVQAVQAQQTAVAHPAHAAGPARARHSPQDRGQREYRGGVCVAADARQPYPLVAAAPARLEAVFLPCPEVECIGKGDVRTPYEFGVKVSIVTTNARAPKFRSRTMFPTRARSNASEMLLHIRSLAGYATDMHEPSFWK